MGRLWSPRNLSGRPGRQDRLQAGWSDHRGQSRTRAEAGNPEGAGGEVVVPLMPAGAHRRKNKHSVVIPAERSESRDPYSPTVAIRSCRDTWVPDRAFGASGMTSEFDALHNLAPMRGNGHPVFGQSAGPRFRWDERSYATAFAASRPAMRPDKMQPPRNVPSSAR